MEEILIDPSFTLFLDRDGVINKNINNGYVLSWDDFEFLPGVLETMPKLAKLFSTIIVVTNQQCIAKGLLTEEDLNDIHQNMMNMIELNGGRIDAVYFAPGLETADNILRKPNNGMALLAQQDFPQIDFSKAIMVGDKLSDMKFGKSLDMITCYLSAGSKNTSLVDFKLPDLSALVEIVKF